MRTRDEIEQDLRKNDLSYHSLETDKRGWAILVPEMGAKVLAAGVDEENVFWVSDRLEKGAWCVGGQQTWLAPELEAHSPAVRLAPGAEQISGVEVLLFKDGIDWISSLARHLVSPEFDTGRLFAG